MKTANLYRPVGLQELDLIAKSNWQSFPPRVEEQPLFYPVLTYDYAQLIITNWNIKEGIANYAGVVTKFKVDHNFITKYKVEIAGGPALQELWIPSDELGEFNKKIVGKINIVGAYYGKKFKGKKIEVNRTLSKEPSELFKSPEEFIKSDSEYQKWLEENQ